MTARREVILAALLTAIDGAGGSTGERNPVNQIHPNDMPAFALYDGGHEIDEVYAGQTQYRMTPAIGLYVAAASGGGTALNALYTAIVQAAMADPTLGGVCDTIREGDMSDPETVTESAPGVRLGKPFMVAIIDLEIDFATVEGDPSTASPFA